MYVLRAHIAYFYPSYCNVVPILIQFFKLPVLSTPWNECQTNVKECQKSYQYLPKVHTISWVMFLFFVTNNVLGLDLLIISTLLKSRSKRWSTLTATLARSVYRARWKLVYLRITRCLHIHQSINWTIMDSYLLFIYFTIYYCLYISKTVGYYILVKYKCNILFIGIIADTT